MSFGIVRARKAVLCAAVGFAAAILPGRASADLSFSSPASETSVTSCKDYFSAEWGARLDMSNSSRHGDILYNIATIAEISELSQPAYSSGVATMTASGNHPYFRLLTPASSGQIIDRIVTRYGDVAPIDPSEYTLLTFRMHSSTESQYSVRWDKSAGNGLGITSPATSYSGWRTYQISLPSATLESGGMTWANGNNYGLAVYPLVFDSGATVKMDWLQLTPAQSECPTFSASYTAAAGDVVSIFVDDFGDTNPADDFQAREAPALYSSGTVTKSWNSTLFYPGTYTIHGFASPDFATHYLNPWDFADTTDIRTTAGVSGGGISNGKYCGTADTGGAQVYLALTSDAELNTSVFNKVSVGYEGSAGVMRVGWLADNGTTGGARHVTVTGDGTYQIDLSGNDGFPGNIGTWSGTISGARASDHLRIDLVGGISNFCINWVSVGTVVTATQPATPTEVSAAGALNLSTRYVAEILMPDEAGGIDYFTSQRANPAALDDTADIDQYFNLDSASLCSAKAYQDNSGATFVGDYITSTNTQSGGSGDGDPQFFAVLRDDDNPIDAEYFKIGCTTMTLSNVSASTDHTVLRFGWESESSGTITGYTGDDIVLKTSGQATYCARLENMPIEENSQTVPGNFWVNPLNSFRVDPHERGEETTTIIADIRLAADHEANNLFAIVVGGDRASAVSIYKNTAESTSGGTLIGTLSANRNSDVYLWDTSAETDGATYYLYTTVADNSLLARGPVKINKSYIDTTAPTLLVDSPNAAGSGRYSTLDVAGWAADNVRLAALEVFIDDTLFDRFVPTEFQLDRKTAYSSLPYASKGGFQRALSISALSDGVHNFRIDAYDSAGNKTQYSTTFTKANSNITSDTFYDVPDEACQTLDVSGPGTPGDSLTFTSTLNGADIDFAVSGMENCQLVRITLASNRAFTKDFTTIWATSAEEDLEAGSANIKASGVPRLKAKNKKAAASVRSKRYRSKAKKKNTFKAFVRADCGDGIGETSTIVINTKKTGDGSKKVKTLLGWIDAVRGTGVKQ